MKNLCPVFMAAIAFWPFVLHGEETIKYTGDGTDLQHILDMTAEHAVVQCEASTTFTFRRPLAIRRPLTLQGLHARLPEKLGRTALIEVYAVDVQDHKGASAANMDVVLDTISAIDCDHIVRTANSPRDHAGLTLRNLVATRCKQPLKISHTRNVVIDGVRIEQHARDAAVPIQLRKCHDVSITGLEIVDSDYRGERHRCVQCTGVTIAATESQPPDVP